MRHAIPLLLLLPLAAEAQPARKNVVLLIADDLGLDLGCYGNGAIRTPHIDALAAAGTRFTHGFACVSSCSPSRATLYTGLHTHHSGQYGLAHGTHNAHTFRHVGSLPNLLGAVGGYRTGIIGKLHVQPKEVYPWDVEIPGGRNVPLMARQAKTFIEQAGDKPFFLVMGYTDPHRAASTFGNYKPVPGVPDATYDPKAVVLPYHLPDAPDTRADVADYYRSVSRLDHGIGLMMSLLKDTKHDGDTLVIFLSDNGIPFPGAKTTLYDPGLHLPLIVKGAMKPLPTLTKPLRSVDTETHEPAQALRERTDSCTVPAAAVVAESMVALVLADAYRQKFGGDHIDDTLEAVKAYSQRIGWHSS